MIVNYQSIRFKVLGELAKEYLARTGDCERIWYALVISMICWLMLQDFNEWKVQTPNIKSLLTGSRLHVMVSQMFMERRARTCAAWIQYQESK